jgi:hypothetical protein
VFRRSTHSYAGKEPTEFPLPGGLWIAFVPMRKNPRLEWVISVVYQQD